MERLSSSILRIGEWRVDPGSAEISRGAKTTRLEVRTLRLLLCLARRAGEVVSIDDLLNDAWAGVTVSQDSVYQAVTSLRRILGDDPKQPTYIATVPRFGYRMVANVEPWKDSPVEDLVLPNGASIGTVGESSPQYSGRTISAGKRIPQRLVWVAGSAAVFCLLIVGVFVFYGRIGSGSRAASAATAAPPLSVAVVPFLDLTEGMQNEEFADGVTEELIDRLSKIEALRVPSPTSSFYFKGKQVPVADMAKTLGVVYLLDGSVRKSGKMVRVAARLVRADNGYVLWTDTYDRPFDDILKVQDDIAGEVAKALKASIAAGTSSDTPR